ncbi:patatin-like phospholipase family protein [Ruegeria atlantica]|uniref:patatin-like phospholipase family protein n=1 Tax=Ruegeria atlantica TaxID=81569 RepID=UPI00147CC885|nr:patatin-like phospholipase family protein [Ruegeria atlantica]
MNIVTRGPGRRNSNHKGVNIALQGGGAHGAFTWGVLDKLFEDDRLWIDAISGTSAGAMNAVVAAHGMHENGAIGAREKLNDFWHQVSLASVTSPIQRSPWAKATGSWSLETSMGYHWMQSMQRMASPYDLNPFQYNPLRNVLENVVDFERVQNCTDMGVFVSATNVETGRVKVFERDEINVDSTMASACLPYLFQAVEIDGVPYWDGGYMGNPPLFPFFHGSPSNDILIIQINPIKRHGTPKRANEIQNRINEITFNSALLHELRAIDFVRRLLDAGQLDETRYKRMNVHIIELCPEVAKLDASSKLNAEWSFLQYLRDTGRRVTESWLDTHFDDLGTKSSANISDMFGGVAALPEV